MDNYVWRLGNQLMRMGYFRVFIINELINPRVVFPAFFSNPVCTPEFFQKSLTFADNLVFYRFYLLQQTRLTGVDEVAQHDIVFTFTIIHGPYPRLQQVTPCCERTCKVFAARNTFWKTLVFRKPNRHGYTYQRRTNSGPTAVGSRLPSLPERRRTMLLRFWE